MDIVMMIETYGYLAVALGTALEGEGVLLVAGLAVGQGMLSFWGVIGFAFVGAVLGDQAFFWMGRVWGDRLLFRLPGLRRRVGQAKSWLHRNKTKVLLGYRFLYGTRGAVLFALGMTEVGPLFFLVMSLLTALVWAILVTGLGVVAGAALGVESLEQGVQGFGLGLALLLVCGWWWKRR
ncbi:MAG TPA: DedA family protein [Desulfomicrobiaceae bacterium]|nr:DedA family protein [Desulfomicrobiaceae bacterium]